MHHHHHRRVDAASAGGAHLLLTIAAAFAAVAAGNAAGFAGVPPEKQEHYTKGGEKFTCDDGSRAPIPLSWVNDDYCDCIDGSDEPGTSACTRGSFWCRNKGHKGKFIPASRVDDGMCDCCDGSDEPQGKSKCTDTCKELGAASLAALRLEIERYSEGVSKMNEMLASASATAAARRAEIEGLKAEADAAGPAIEAAEAAKKEAEAKEEEERAVKVAAWESRKAEREAAAAAASESGSGEDKIKVPAPEGDSTDAAAAAGEGSEATEAPAEDQQKTAEAEDPDPKDWKSPEADAARSAYDAAKKTQDDANDKRVKVEDKANADLGPGGVFTALQEECVDSNDLQYGYSLCPYQHVKQDGSVTVGRWKGWEDVESKGHTVMVFDGGDRCWNGPDRSIKVRLECSNENKIIKVEEPERCVYDMRFATPAVCREEHLLELRKQLEASEKDLQ